MSLPRPSFLPLRTVLTALGDLFIPRTCLACGRVLGARERDLCLFCRADLPLTHYWELSHNPMADRFNLLIQRDLEERLPAPPPGETGVGEGVPKEPYAWAAALFFYHSDAGYRKIPQALKYKGAVAAGRRFGRLLGMKLAGSPSFAGVDAVIPVPLHWRRRWKRGYNQAEVLAREIAGVLHARMFPHLLYRSRATRTQTRLSVGEKARNVSGAFRLRPHARDILTACFCSSMMFSLRAQPSMPATASSATPSPPPGSPLPPSPSWVPDRPGLSRSIALPCRMTCERF